MATGNEKINAINSLVAGGYDVNIRGSDDNTITVISVSKNESEVGYFIDKTIHVGKSHQKKIVSAWDIFTEEVQHGWPEND